MDNLSIIIQAKLNAIQSGQAINQQIQSLSKQLAPLQLKLDTATSVKDIKILENGMQQLQKHILGATDSYGNQVKIVQKLNAETDKMVVSQLKLTENNKLYNASLMETQALKNAYNKQMFNNFNQSLGIGVVDPNRITASNSALREYYANMDRISRVSTVRTSDAINNSLLLTPNRINASNSALREYYTQLDRVSRVSTVGTSEAIGNTFNNFRNLDTNRITASNSALAQLFTNSNRNINSMTELERRVVSLNPAMANLARHTHDSAQSFGSSAVKMLQWSIIGTAIFGTIRQISSGFKYIYELENNLNQVRIVTGQTQEEVESLAVSYNKLAKEMSVTTRELTSTAADLFRQGLDNNQVEDRMKAIVQYAKISSISLKDSNKIITATANATGESVTKIIDVFALLGDTTASGANEIGEALQRVASASENSNISLEKSASWLATISSITRESASTIGRSLNSVISRYESIKKTGFNSEDETKINDVVKALSDVGIKATDSQGQLLDFAIIMDTVGEKFGSLSKNEKAYIATTMFGTFQRNRGITLLNNYQDSLKNYENALNAAGTAEEKFAIYQESSAASLDRLRVSWETFWQSSISTDFIKGGLNSLSYLIDTFGNLRTIIIAVTTAILIFNGTNLTNWFRTSIIAAQGFRAGMISTGVATNGLTLSMNALKVAFLSNPFGFIAVAVLTLVSAYDILLPMLGNMKSDYEELNEIEEERIKSIQKEAETHKALASQYEEDIKRTKQLIDTRNELEKSSSELADTDSKKIDINASIINSEQELGNIIGQEALNRLKAAGFSQDASNIVIQALQEKQNAEKIAYENSSKLVSQQTDNLRRNIITQIKQIDSAVQAYGILGKLQENGLWIEKKLIYARYKLNPTPDNAKAYDEIKNQIESFYDQQKSNKISKLLEQLNSLGGTSIDTPDIPNLNGGVSGNTSGSSSKSSSKNDPSYESLTDATIRLIQVESNLTATKSKSIETDLSQAKSQKNYQKELELTTSLLSNQSTQIQQLGLAKQKLESEFARTSQSSGFSDTSLWFDQNGEQTLTYLSKFNSSSKETQDQMKLTFDSLSKLKKAWSDNSTAIQDLTQSQNELKTSLSDLSKTLSTEVIEATKKLAQSELDIEEKSLKSYITRKELKIKGIQEEIDALEEKADIENEQEERAKRLLDIEKAKQNLNNLSKEKDTRILVGDTWTWQANPQKVAEANENLKNLQEDYAEWEEDNDLKHKKAILQAEIDYQQSLIDKREESFEKQKEIFDEQWKNIDDMSTKMLEQFGSNVDNAVKILAEKLITLNAQLAAINAGSTNLPDSLNSGSSSNSSSGGNTIVYNNGPNGWTEYDSNGNAIAAGTTPRYANGTESASGGLSLVGEKGAELRVLNQGDGIIPTSITKNLMALGANPLNYMQNILSNISLLKVPDFSRINNSPTSPINTYNINIAKVETQDAGSFIDLLPTLVHQYK